MAGRSEKDRRRLRMAATVVLAAALVTGGVVIRAGVAAIDDRDADAALLWPMVVIVLAFLLAGIRLVEHATAAPPRTSGDDGGGGDGGRPLQAPRGSATPPADVHDDDPQHPDGPVVTSAPEGRDADSSGPARSQGVRFVLVRHGEKDRRFPVDQDRPLSARGAEQVMRLAARLNAMDVHPTLYLTSPAVHAAETADLLREALSPSGVCDKVVSLGTGPKANKLTGGDPWLRLDAVLNDGGAPVHALATGATVALVGHEPGLSQMLTRMTGQRTRPLDQAEAWCLCECQLRALRAGHAKLDFRSSFRNLPAGELGSKLQSKMQVATLLAGFTAAALVQLLTVDTLSGWHVAGGILLTLSVALFVTCTYVYDELAMPEGFWAYGSRPSSDANAGLQARLSARGWKLGNGLRSMTARRARAMGAGFDFYDAAQYGGAVYAYMVWAWMFIFTPAVACGALGLVFLMIATKSLLLSALGATAMLGVLCYLVMVTPRLGTD